MSKVDPVLISVIADWLINFSMFWFGVAIVSPVFPGIDPPSKLAVLTIDILFGTLTLFVAYRLRRELS